MKLLFLDTETTGLDPLKNGVIQIAGIIEIDGVVIQEFDYKVKPFQKDVVDLKALKVNGRTIDEIAGFSLPVDVYRDIMEIFTRHIDKYDKTDKFSLVGQNVHFDYDFLNEFFKKCGSPFLYAYIDYHMIDVITATALFTIAGKMHLQNMKLKTVCDHFGIPLEAHDALEDVRATRLVFHRYLEMIKCIP